MNDPERGEASQDFVLCGGARACCGVDGERLQRVAVDGVKRRSLRDHGDKLLRGDKRKRRGDGVRRLTSFGGICQEVAIGNLESSR